MNLESTAYKGHLLAAVVIYLVNCLSAGGVSKTSEPTVEIIEALQSSSGSISCIFEGFLSTAFNVTLDELQPYVRFVAMYLIVSPVFSMAAVDRKAAQVCIRYYSGHTLRRCAGKPYLQRKLIAGLFRKCG